MSIIFFISIIICFYHFFQHRSCCCCCICNRNRFRTSQSRNKFFSENLQITLIHFFFHECALSSPYRQAKFYSTFLFLANANSLYPLIQIICFFLTAAFFLLQDKFHTILHGSEQYRMLYLYPEFFSDLYFLQLSGFLQDDA